MGTAKEKMSTSSSKVSRFFKKPFAIFKKKEPIILEEESKPPEEKPRQEKLPTLYETLQNTVFDKSNKDALIMDTSKANTTIKTANSDLRIKNDSESSQDSGFDDEEKGSEKHDVFERDENDVIQSMKSLSIDKVVPKKKNPKVLTLSRGPIIKSNGHAHVYNPYLVAGSSNQINHINRITYSGGKLIDRSSHKEVIPKNISDIPILTQDVLDVLHPEIEDKLINTAEETNFINKNFDYANCNGGNTAINEPSNETFDNTNGTSVLYNEFYQHVDFNTYPVFEPKDVDTFDNTYESSECFDANVNQSNVSFAVSENTENVYRIEPLINEVYDELSKDMVNNKEEYQNVIANLFQDICGLTEHNVSNEQQWEVIDQVINVSNKEVSESPNMINLTVELNNGTVETSTQNVLNDTEQTIDLNEVNGINVESYANLNSVSSHSSFEHPSPIYETPPNSNEHQPRVFSPPMVETRSRAKELSLPDYKRMQQKLDRELSLECCNGSRMSCKDLFQEYLVKLTDLERERMHLAVAKFSLKYAYGFLLMILLELKKLNELVTSNNQPKKEGVTENKCYSSLYLICLRILEQDSTFFIKNETGLKLLSAAVSFCPDRPLITRFLVVCIRSQYSKVEQKGNWIFNEVDERGENLLMACAGAGDVSADVLCELVRGGGTPLFNIHHVNNEGCMALHIACKLHSAQSPRLRIVHVLLKHGGADIWAQEKKTSETAAHFAVNSAHSDLNLVLLLFFFVQKEGKNDDRKRLARFKAISEKSFSPLDYAKQKQKSNADYPKEILQYLKKLR